MHVCVLEKHIAAESKCQNNFIYVYIYMYKISSICIYAHIQQRMRREKKTKMAEFVF